MPLLKLQFRPGITRDLTSYAAEGGWYDCDKIRFRMGYPESIGGWERLTASPFIGTCRAVHSWTALDNTAFIGLGTHLKYYIVQGSSPNDVTPIRQVSVAGTTTFAASNASASLVVTDVGHSALLGDFVTFSGADSLGGAITSDVLNSEFQITEIIDGSTYRVEAPVAANASDTGNGGASTVATYQINTGLDTVVDGTGWGADPWSVGGWGSAANTTIPGAQLRLWSHDNYGEDLLMNVRDGGIYYWDRSEGPATRAVELSELAGANSVPTVARQVLVSDQDRHAIAFGCDDEFSSGVQDPLLLRFSAQEDVTDWETRANNTAGSLRISSGSQIVAAIKTKQQILVFTDVSLHTVQYIGPPFTFGLSEVSHGLTIAGQNAAAAVNDSIYWMGRNQFYVYNGTVQEIPCTVKEFVFTDINQTQIDKVFAGHNPEFSEVWWFYPSADSLNNDRYVIFNYAQNIWYFGALERTAWEGSGVQSFPIAASRDGYIYTHESGINDGSQNPPVAIASYIQSAAFDLGDGDRFMFARRVIPDITFRTSDDAPLATITLTTQDYPGGGVTQESSGSISRTVALPIEQYTDRVDVRMRGRSMSFRIGADQYNTAWRLGVPRVDLRTDGGR